MSRHRFMKSINLKDELDDDALSDGGEEDISPEYQEQFDMAFAQARSILGSSETSGISDLQIKDAIWEFYFDVEKSVDWLLEQQSKRNAVKERKEQAASPSSPQPLSALQRLSLAQSVQHDKPSLVSLARLSQQTSGNTSKDMTSNVLSKTTGVSKLSLLVQSKGSQASSSPSLGSPARPNVLDTKANPSGQSKLALKSLKFKEAAIKSHSSPENEKQPPTVREIYSHPPAPNLLGLPSRFALALSSSTPPSISPSTNLSFSSSAFAFETASPDDLAFQARQKTALPARARRS